tara:strand:- start:125 stop:2110 length:1986 start_codon:yes stop_codon:yes gene_type:complete
MTESNINTHTINKKYINSIDGLRALAVLSVMVFHLNPVYLPGGFTGVDIFFVISGYVVAKSLSSRASSTFSDFIKNFYKRRLVRIYPALLACLIFTSLVVIFFIPRFYMSKSIDETGLAAFFGFSNVVLALDTESYFSLSTDFNPFVHTWSLGVEEQFYFIFPVLFYFWLGNKFKYSIQILFVISICLSYLYLDNNVNKAYYLVTSRFWELAAGVMLYQYHHSKSNSVKMTDRLRGLTLTGGLFITVLGLILSDKNQFPLPWAILPVVGTCLLLHGLVATSNHKPLVEKCFSISVLRHFGKLSYSLYLWHWPIFTFFRWTIGLQTYPEYVFATILTYLFAAASYYFLETKFPKINIVSSLSSSKVLKIALPSISVLALGIFLGYKGQPILSFSETANRDVWSPYIDFSTPQPDMSLSGRTLFVIGDSHAGAYSKMLEKLSQETGLAIIRYGKGGCGITNMRKPVLIKENPCLDRLNGWLEEIKQTTGPNDIIFFATLKLKRSVLQSSIMPGDLNDSLRELEMPQTKLAMQNAFDESEKVIKELSQNTKLMIIDAPMPVFNYIAFRCADWYTANNPICGAGYTERRELMERLRAQSLNNIKKLKRKLNFLTIWDPMPLLCSEETCSLYRNKKPIYFDSDHLSGFGNEFLYEDFKNKLFKVIK